MDRDLIKIDEEAIADSLFNAIAKDGFSKKRDGVSGRRCREADVDSIKMLKRIAPNACLLRTVAAMAFVGDDEIEA